MTRILLAAALALGAPAFAGSHAEAEIPEDTQVAIMEVLAGMNCQMALDDIEATEDGSYNLDDVICEGGNQFDIVLGADLSEVSRRAE